MSYCQQCGSKQVKELDGWFSPKTGKPTYRMVCPKNPCDHGFHNFDWSKSTIFRAIAGQGWCSRCKKWIGVGD